VLALVKEIDAFIEQSSAVCWQCAEVINDSGKIETA